MKTCVLPLAAVLISAGLSANPPAQKSEPLRAPFRPSLETVLVENGEPRAVVLTPEDSSCAKVAQDFVRRFEKATGARLPTQPEAAVRRRSPQASALVVFGNVSTGPLSLRLYANRLITSDSLYPGVDGYELRTIPSALDLGVNVLFLGGSSSRSVQAAVDALLKRVKPGRTVSIPFMLQWVSSSKPAPGPLTNAEIEERLADARDTLGAFRSKRDEVLCEQFCHAARDYYLSGEDSYARVCMGLLDLLAAYYKEHPSARPPTFWLRFMVMALDQIEECPILTDADRLKAAEWVRQTVENTMDYWEMRGPKRRYEQGELTPTWNHETFPALSVAHAAQYLKARYRVGAADYWEAVADHLFRGQITCDQPLEDSANYQWAVPIHAIEYVTATGRLQQYLTNGMLKQCMEYAIASHDSQGYEATHGDAFRTFSSLAGPLFGHAIAIYKDPRYKWLLDRIDDRKPDLWHYPVQVAPSAPDDHVGLRTFTVHPARCRAYGIEGIEPDCALDKAVFRSGWDSNADYLMLDGLNVGNHKHLDANAIIRFSTQRRFWLVDMDYIRAAPKHHNSIAVVRNGVAPDQRPLNNGYAQVIAQPPFAAKLVCSASRRDCALTQSLLADYAGLDWSRSIFWQAKDFFVVIDQLRARAAGDYVIRCFWRTLGEAQLEGNALHVRQRGERGAASDDLRIVKDGGRQVVEFGTRKGKIVFEHDLPAGTYRLNVVAKGCDSSSDSLWLQVDQGERVPYHLPIGKYGGSSGTYEKTAPGPSIHIQKAGAHRLEVSMREAPVVRLDKLVLTPAKGRSHVIEVEDIVREQFHIVEEPEQHFFIVNAGGVRLALREHFDYGSGGRDGYFVSYPYADKVTRILVQTKVCTLKTGEAVSFANLFCVRGGDAVGAKPWELRPVRENVWAVAGDSRAVVGFGPLKLDGLEIDDGMFMLTEKRLLTAGAQHVAPEPSTLGLAACSELVNQLTQRSRPASLPREAVSIKAPSLPVLWRSDFGSAVTALATGASCVIAGTEDGHVAQLDAKGQVLWRKPVGSRVRSVACATFADSRRTVLVGTHAGHAKALDAASGAELWTYECQPYRGRTGSVGTVFPADLDGDGAHEVVAGSDNNHYHALSASGKLLWRANTVHASTAGAAGDIDGDGRDEVAAGTEYYWPRLLDSDGKILLTLSAGPVTSAAAVFDTDADGKAEAFFGMEDCFVRCLRGGKEQWRANVGGAPTAIAPLDIDGDGKPEILCASESFSVYALRADASLAWRTQLPESINDLAVVGERIVAGCDDSRIYVLSRSGKILGTSSLPTPAANVRKGDDRTVAVSAGRSVLALDVGD